MKNRMAKQRGLGTAVTAIALTALLLVTACAPSLTTSPAPTPTSTPTSEPTPPSPDASAEEQMVYFILKTKYEDLPPAVIEWAKKAILDTLAVTIAGSSQEGIPEVIDLVKGWGGTEESTILVHGGKVPAPNAAFANGPQARALDMGDVHEEGGHSGEYILPALLAAAELRAQRGQPVSGKEFITAYVVGGEVLARVGNFCQAISRPTGNPIFGWCGGTAAVAKVLNLNQEQTWNALGISYVTYSGWDMQMYLEGALMCRVHHAQACQDEVTNVLLAEKGITGPKEIFMPFIFQHYPRNVSSEGYDKLTEGLGTTWEFAEGTMIKPYQCCKIHHPWISAVISCIEENDIDAASIEKIALRVANVGNPMGFFEPYRYNPQSFVDCQFSAPWTVATAAFDGHVFLDSYEDIYREEVRALMPNVVATIDDTLTGWSAIATITVDGKEYSKRVDYVLGHPKNPVGWDWLIEKLNGCAAYSAVPIPEANLTQLVAKVQGLENIAGVGEIISLVTP